MRGEEDLMFDLKATIEQYYGIQKLRVQSYNRIVGYIRDYLGWKPVARHVMLYNELPVDNDLIEKAKSFEEFVEMANQKYNLLKVPEQKWSWFAERVLKDKADIEEIDSTVWTTKQLINIEDELAKRIKGILDNFQIYTDYLSKIRGIGPTLAGGLIAWFYPVSRFKYASKMRAYAGISGQHYRMECEEGHKIIATSPKEICQVPNKDKKGKICGARIVEVKLVKSPPKRVAGYFTMVNFKLKALMWRLVRCFEYQSPTKSYYRFLYDKAKQYYAARDPDLPKGRIRTRAILWTASMFISHFWEVWRRLEGLPVREPYPVEKLGHTKIIPMTDEPSPLCPQFKFDEVSTKIEPKVPPKV